MPLQAGTAIKIDLESTSKLLQEIRSGWAALSKLAVTAIEAVHWRTAQVPPRIQRPLTHLALFMPGFNGSALAVAARAACDVQPHYR